MDEKRKMQEILNRSLSGLTENPFLAQRVIAQAKGEEPVKKKLSFSIVFIIAILLIGTVTALAAGVEDINAMLYKLWPEAARALRPLNLSVENDGIRLDVISATLSDDHLLITYSLTDLKGNRINDKTKCSTLIMNPMMSETSSSDKMISFDVTNHQAVFATYYEYSSMEYPESVTFGDAGMIHFTVDGVTNPETIVLDLWPLMKNQDYNVESVPGPDDPFVLNVISNDENTKKGKIPNVLNPANNLHIPITKDIELSGIGWVDGMMHVQIHVSDYFAKFEAENKSSEYARKIIYINLRDQQGNDVMWAPGFFEELMKEMPYYIWEINWRDGDDLWIEKIFAVQPEEMEQYIIYSELTDRVPDDEYENLLQYEWSVSFPTNLIQVKKSK
jgi:hypothetical protein